MSKLKTVLHRSLQKRKLTYWESDGVFLSGSKSDDAIALDTSFKKLIEIHDRIVATLDPTWLDFTSQFDALVLEMNELATTEVASNAEARKQHKELIDATAAKALKLESDIGLEVERRKELLLLERQAKLEQALKEQEELRKEQELERLAEIARKEEEERIAEAERLKLAEKGVEAELERARREEERQPANKLRKKFEEVATKLIATLQILNSSDFAIWPNTANLKQTIAEYRMTFKRNFTQSDREIARQYDSIRTQMDEALHWANECTLQLKPLLNRKAELVEALKIETEKAAKLAERGEADDKEEVNAELVVVQQAADEAFSLLEIDKIPSLIESLAKSLAGIAEQIEGKFVNRAKKLEEIKGKDYARVHAESSIDDQRDLEKTHGQVITAIKVGTLLEVDKALKSLRETIESTDSFNKSVVDAKSTYPSIKEQYHSILAIKPTALKDSSNSKTLTKLQELLEEVWKTLNDYIEKNDWLNASDYILGGRFPDMLSSAAALVVADGEAAEALAEAKRKAEKLRREQEERDRLAEEKRQAEAREQREKDLEAGIAEGDKRFLEHKSSIIQKVWLECKKHVPAKTNCSIGGTYSYTAITEAIKVWQGRVEKGLFNSIHVPGGGRIEDKRKKNPERNEIQANFIADWDGNPINVHVNLRAEDWSLVRV